MLVQEYLKEQGLEALLENYNIKATFHEDLPLVILNYDQIESCKTLEIVRECRGLVLEVGTWKLVARSFGRFFNWGEVADEMHEFDWDNCHALSKEDGSLGILYNYNDSWMFNTRGSFGQGLVHSSDVSWEELFCHALGIDYLCELSDNEALSKDECYVFELTSPLNKIVRMYPESGLYLLTIFHGEKEYDVYKTSMLRECLNKSGLKVKATELEHFSSADDVLEKILNRSVEDPTFEGYVVRDKDNNRWKIKSKTYVSLHHMRGEDNLFNPKYQLPFILNGETDEVIGYFPEAKESIYKNQEIVDKAFDSLNKLWHKTWEIENQRDFGLRVALERFSSILFTLRKEHGDNQTIDLLRKQWKQSGDIIYKTLFKKKK